MNIFQADTVNDAYRDVMRTLLMRGKPTANTRELQNCIIEITKPSLDDMLFFYRPLSMKYALADYYAGDKDKMIEAIKAL